MIIPARNQWYGWTDIVLIQALLIWTDTPPVLTWGGCSPAPCFSGKKNQHSPSAATTAPHLV